SPRGFWGVWIGRPNGEISTYLNREKKSNAGFLDTKKPTTLGKSAFLRVLYSQSTTSNTL
ncbi:hypothetical protein AB4589_23125, partial [Vibrio sp. 10N.222.49.A3]|uniref:hypothetical protein n=1 Tax=Vibrio sp. 10N.222.49.A3 TaxID=3229611 RepID=UPI00354FE889